MEWLVFILSHFFAAAAAFIKVVLNWISSTTVKYIKHSSQQKFCLWKLWSVIHISFFSVLDFIQYSVPLKKLSHSGPTLLIKIKFFCFKPNLLLFLICDIYSHFLCILCCGTGSYWFIFIWKRYIMNMVMSYVFVLVIFW